MTRYLTIAHGVETMPTIENKTAKIEQISINIDRYRTPENEPTCAIDFEKGLFCDFYMSTIFKEKCFFDGDNNKLERSGKKQDGFLIPNKDCPVWSTDNARD